MSANKRRRTAGTCDLQSGKCNRNTYYPRYTLDTLPPEVLEMIMRMFSFHEVATIIRLISRKFCMVATALLNGAFLSFGAKLENAMNCAEAKIPMIKTDLELIKCLKLVDGLELIKGYYNMLRTVTWRYTHPPRKGKFTRLCFYAGSILDELNGFLSPSYQPSSLTTMCIPEPPISIFIIQCKRFMDFFERVSERKLNRSPFISGCKVVDILDCLVEGRQVLSFRVSSRRGVVSMRLKYVMKRTWFTCLQIPRKVGEDNWRDEQKFMYLRLRRLVASINDHHYEKLRFERVLLLQFLQPPHPKPPPASTYSGYGEYAGQFFYYGNMNKEAYERKCNSNVASNPRTAGAQNRQERNEMNQRNNRNTRETRKDPEVTCFSLVANVDLRCSPELAPLAIRNSLNLDNYEVSNYTNCPQEFFLRLHINCPASIANRLPANFTWELRGPDKRRRNY
ncbi:uncharacterized protein [Prorops nasuta]|uniref:uncharacterized protein n=1 Tax=Prorops nasuta TaxID=863751 RepID=UPI0034CF135C